MTDFIMRLFVKNYDKTEEPEVREKIGMAAGTVGIAANFLLFSVKLFAGLVSGSISVLADAVNNLADSGSSIVTLVGFKLSKKPADENHPFGHARIEYLSGIAVSFIVLLLGFQLGKEALEILFLPQNIQYPPAAFVILILSVFIKLWQFMFFRRVGKKINSDVLYASSRDSLNDTLSTGAVLLGAAVTYFSGFDLDGFTGLSVAVFIIVSGVKLIKDTADPLLGMAPDKELVKSICGKIRSYEGVVGIHDLMVHNYGVGRCFASVHCEVPAQRDILESHDLIDNIEKDFKRDLGINLVIHLDPVVVGDERTDKLHEQVDSSIKNIYPQVSVHDFRVVWSKTHTKILFDIAAPFSLGDSDETLRRTVEHEIKNMDPSYFPFITVDRKSIGDI